MPDPHSRALEAAIDRDPYDLSAYTVYADHLQAQGDPRGELIGLQLGAEIKDDARLAQAARALIERDAARFLGPLAAHQKSHDGNAREAFTWRFGFIHAARLSHSRYAADGFDGSLADLLAALLAHPSGRFVTELALGLNGDSSEAPLDDLVALLVERAPATLRRLHLGDFEFPDETEMSWYHVGDLRALWPAVPRLRSLIVQGGEFELGALDLPELSHVEIRTGGLTAANAQAIAAARWPHVEHLEVWYGDPSYGGTATLADAAALLDRADLGQLTALGVKNASFSDALCGVLPRARVLPRLRRLDLAMGTMTDDGARVLAASKAAFQHLEVLDVSQNYLTAAGVAALKGVARSVVSNSQREDHDPEYRHPSVGE